MHSWIFQWKWMNNRDVIMTSFLYYAVIWTYYDVIMTFYSWIIMIWWTCEWGRYLGFLIGQNLIGPNQLKNVFLHFGIGDDVSDPKYSKLVLDQDQHKLNQSDTRNFHQWIEHVMNSTTLGQILHNEYSNHQERLNLSVKLWSNCGQTTVKRWLIYNDNCLGPSSSAMFGSKIQKIASDVTVWSNTLWIR